MAATVPRISICVCTFRRPQLLDVLLQKIPGLKTDGLFSCAVVVVDNDEKKSAQAVVERFREKSGIPVSYDWEPERSISLARNRTVRNSDGEFVAFIDDDEFPDENWLLNHYKLLVSSKADGVLGPVLPYFEPGSPRWLAKSGLLDRERFPTGTVLRDYRYTRTGNVLIRRSVFSDPEGSFDPKYGKTGGSDAVFFKRMIEKGKVFLWSDEAQVFESVPLERQTRTYYLRRACTRGMTAAWEEPFFSVGTVKSVFAFTLYIAALPFLFIAGHHLFMRYLVKDCDHLAKLLAYMKIRLVSERPYKQAAAQPAVAKDTAQSLAPVNS